MALAKMMTGNDEQGEEGNQWIALTEWELVPFLETKGTVGFPPECHELVGSLLFWDTY